MPENPSNQIRPDSPQHDASSVLDQPAVDFVLQSVVDLANTAGIELGITLCVGGIVVSGQLISGKKYFEEIANDALQAKGPADQAEVRKTFSDYLGNFGKLIYRQAETEENKEDGATTNRTPGFIHLRDAKFFHNSGQPMPGKGLRWRGRLCAVDGFSFGALLSS